MTDLSSFQIYIKQTEEECREPDKAELNSDAALKAKKVSECMNLVRDVFEIASQAINNSSKAIRAKNSEAREKSDGSQNQFLLTLNRDYVKDPGGGVGTYVNYTVILAVVDTRLLNLNCTVITGDGFPRYCVFDSLQPTKSLQFQNVLSVNLDDLDLVSLRDVLSSLITDQLQNIQKQPRIQWYY